MTMLKAKPSNDESGERGERTIEKKCKEIYYLNKSLRVSVKLSAKVWMPRGDSLFYSVGHFHIKNVTVGV